MAKDWESTFRAWSKPPSATEEEKCARAESMIYDAIKNDEILRAKNIEVFTQGSYRNNTNVRLESDVDICVLCKDVFFYDLPVNKTKSDAGIYDAQYTYVQFRNDVGTALVNKFGMKSIKRGNKAFDVHENTCRVDADVVACFEHRLYHIKPDGSLGYRLGTELRPDNGGRIINWPKQNYDNGVVKNTATNYRYKYIVRAMKKLKIDMDDNKVAEAEPVSSFLIESMLWNVPNKSYGNESYVDDIKNGLSHILARTSCDNDCNDWTEVNDIKYLFRDSQPWTRAGARAFAELAWRYVGLG